MTAPDFWLTSGFHLLERDDDGLLRVTDDYLRAYLARPEVAPVDDSCDAERRLHAALVEAPRRPVDGSEIAAIADTDTAENYGVLLEFRDRLVAAGTLEACYRGLFDDEQVPIPRLFVDQMVHAILRNILDGCTDPVRLRAAELLFRAQKVAIDDDAVMLADDEIVEMRATADGASPGNLLVGDAPARRIELDILGPETASQYWERSDQFDMVLDIGFARAGLDALCRVLESWVGHLAGVEVGIQPMQSIEDEKWVWHVGLDVEATTILNDLYEGASVTDERLGRIVALFRLRFSDPAAMLASVAGRPVYLAAAMTPDGRLRLKPQNLLVNLPLAEIS
ncbi:MAG: hypothetical protein HKM95_03100 [Inquilinus sp.]|nr:hypothetical protein [Inquilinus sp.]